MGRGYRAGWLIGWLAVAVATGGGCDMLAEKGKASRRKDDDDGGKRRRSKKRDRDDRKKKDDDEDDTKGEKRVVKVATYEADDYHWACAHHPGNQTFKLRSLPRRTHEKDVEAATELLERLAKLGAISDKPLLRGIEEVGDRIAVGMLPDRTRGPYTKGQLIVLVHPSRLATLIKADPARASFLLAHELGHLTAEHAGPPEARKPDTELAADRFAGRLLGLEGRSLGASASWILQHAAKNAEGAKAARKARLEALAEGWRAGCKTGGKCKDPEEPLPGETKTAANPEPPPPDDGPPTTPKPGKGPKKGSFSDREGR
ncbi:MAG: hypothetical protein AAF928_16935 [Myxococcota bacterium]